jgi:hypothetical protein
MTEPEALPEPPGHLLELVQRLIRQGFEEIETEYSPESFGNVLRVFERAPVRVRVVRDRGDWSAEVTAQGWSRPEHFGEDWVVLPPVLSDPD